MEGHGDLLQHLAAQPTCWPALEPDGEERKGKGGDAAGSTRSTLPAPAPTRSPSLDVQGAVLEKGGEGRCGMACTLVELARLFNAEKKRGEGGEKKKKGGKGGVAPSPNLRTLPHAILYPGCAHDRGRQCQRRKRKGKEGRKTIRRTFCAPSDLHWRPREKKEGGGGDGGHPGQAGLVETHIVRRYLRIVRRKKEGEGESPASCMPPRHGRYVLMDVRSA